MKKILSFILVLSLGVALISCGNSSASSTATSSTDAIISSTEKSSNSQNDVSSTENTNLDELTKTYLRPIALSGIGAQNWLNANDIRADSFNAFYVVIANPPSGESEAPTVSETEYEDLIQKYFDVSTDYLRTSEYYDSSTKTYMLDGIGEAAGYRVVSESQSGDIVTMEYEYISAEDNSTVVFKGTLTVKLEDNGDYKYISCEN